MRSTLIAALAAQSILASAEAETLIVGNKAESTVSFIDLEIGAEVARRETGPAPHEIAVSPDGKRAVVVSYRADDYVGESLHVFDIQRAERIGIIDLAGHLAPHGLKWPPGASHVIATTEATKDLVIVDVDAGEIVASIDTLGAPTHMLALSPDGSRAYATSIDAGAFAVVDLAARKTRRLVKAGSGSEAIAMTPDGGEIWVGANRSKEVTVFDAKSLRAIAAIQTEGVPIRVEISPDGAFAAISEFDRGRVIIIDVSTRTPVASIDLDDARRPVTLLFSPTGDRLWAAATGSRAIVEIDTKDWRIARTLAAGEGSDGLGFSPLDVSAGKLSGE